MAPHKRQKRVGCIETEVVSFIETSLSPSQTQASECLPVERTGGTAVVIDHLKKAWRHKKFTNESHVAYWGRIGVTRHSQTIFAVTRD